jgi:hypothetical protein
VLPSNVLPDVMCFTASHSLILIQVIDAKFEAEEQVRKKAALLKEQRWNTLVKSQKVQSNTTDKVIKLESTRQYMLLFTNKK